MKLNHCYAPDLPNGDYRFCICDCFSCKAISAYISTKLFMALLNSIMRSSPANNLHKVCTVGETAFFAPGLQMCE